MSLQPYIFGSLLKREHPSLKVNVTITMKLKRHWLSLAFSLLLLSACGGDSDSPTPTKPIPDEQVQPTEPEPTEPGPTEPGPTEPTEPLEQRSSFILPVIPDTQFYSRYDHSIFASQTKWLAENATTLAIPMVLHLGDVVDQVNQEDQWRGANEAMKILDDAGLPYSILAGNHDVLNSANWDDQRDLIKEPYLIHFSKERQELQSTFGGVDATGLNTWHTFEAQGQKFLVLALSWRPSAQTRAWANEVLRAHPTLPTILSTHQLISISDGKAIDPTDDAGSGQSLWDEVIAPNNQIFLTLNGHYHGAAHRIKKNEAGLDVIQILVDYQMAADGGNGYMRLMEFDLGNNNLRSYAYSPWLAQRPVEERTYIDKMELTEEPDSFTIPFDFEQRFRAFNPNYTAPKAGNKSYIDDAREILKADDYTLPADPRKPATDENDFVRIDETRAHWRFVRPAQSAAGDSVPDKVKNVIQDISGNGNDLERQIVLNTQGQKNNSQLDQVTWSDEHHPYSAASGSVCFIGSRDPKIVNFMQTAVGAPINSDTFEDGYTIEAIVKVDDFTESQHRWAKILSQTSYRNQVPGWKHSEDATGASVVLGISNLREAQWEVVPANTAEQNQAHFTNWSHELPDGRWQHIAIVNDGNKTDMYVEGVKVLRNSIGSKGLGIANGGKPWRIAAGTSNGLLHYGFNGCINEIRMTARPLQPSEWLTARP